MKADLEALYNIHGVRTSVRWDTIDHAVYDYKLALSAEGTEDLPRKIYKENGTDKAGGVENIL